jgi:hypothetical protein
MLCQVVLGLFASLSGACRKKGELHASVLDKLQEGPIRSILPLKTC